jgi:hypothetical protein
MHAGPPPGPPGPYRPPPPQWNAPPDPYFARFAPKPGCVPLRPLTISDILDGSFRSIRRNPRCTLGLSAIVAVLQVLVLTLFQVVVYLQLRDARTGGANRDDLDVGQLLSLLSSLFSIVVLSAVFGAVLTGMLTHVITQDVLGNRVTIAAVWDTVRPRILSLIGLSILVALLQLIGLVLLIVPGVWLWGALSVSVPALMVENLGVRAAMRRSRQLVRGTFWRVWGIRALGTIITSILAGFASAPFTVAAAVVSGHSLNHFADTHQGVPVAYLVITAIGTVLSTTFVAPIKAGVDALLYTDLRMRKEGLDIQLQHLVASRARPA